MRKTRLEEPQEQKVSTDEGKLPSVREREREREGEMGGRDRESKWQGGRDG